MAEALVTLTKLLTVQEIHEDASGATLRFHGCGQGQLALADVNYASHLRLARRSQERQHPVGVRFGGRSAIVEMIRADNDVLTQLWEEDAGRTRVMFQGHDGVFHIDRDHPEFARIRTLLGEMVGQQARVWFIAQKRDLGLLDVQPVTGPETASQTPG